MRLLAHRITIGTGPGRPSRRLPGAVIGWAAGYGGLQAYWAVTGRPGFGELGTDLLVFTGWWTVGLGLAAALVAGLLARARTWRPVPAVAGLLVSGALGLSCALLLLDLVGLLLLHLGPAFSLPAFASRLGCLAGAVLLAAVVLEHRRRHRGDCGACGRTGPPATPGERPPPAWARWAAYLAVTGCLVRLIAQWAVGFEDLPGLAGASVLVFEIGFLMAGVLLPLSLVHSWGRRWPGWVPGLRGRPVPRRLLLVPAAVLAAGLVGYFGVGIGKLVVETATGTWDPGDGRYPLSFFWVAMPAYWVWGLGLGLAAFSRQQRTRRPCPDCGR